MKRRLWSQWFFAVACPATVVGLFAGGAAGAAGAANAEENAGGEKTPRTTATVELQAEAVCDGPRVYLRDAAKLRGETDRVLDLAPVDLGPAPRAEKTTVLSRAKIEAALRAALPAARLRGVSFTGVESVRVRPATQVISGACLAAAARAAMEKLLHGRAPLEYRVEVVGRVRKLSVPRESYRLRVEPPADAARPGRRRVRVEIRHQAELLRTVYVTVRVRLFARVPAATTELRPGVILTAAAWRWERRELSSLEHVWPAKAGTPTGMTPTRVVRAGRLLEARFLRAPKVIRRRQAVRLLLADGALRVEGRGTALNDAAAGETVYVRPLGGSRIVAGRAFAGGLVEVR